MGYSLTDTFEAHANQTDEDVDFWLARDIQHLKDFAAEEKKTLQVHVGGLFKAH